MYDAIVVGARCAGSSLSMLLARQGYRVLLVDRATFPSDTISTQFIWQPGVACLQRWGLLDRLRATGCPPIHELGFDPGPFQLRGTPPPDGDATEMYAPRRTVLDKLLVDAAAEAGVEVIQGFTVSALTTAQGRVTGIRGRKGSASEIAEQAKIVVGADGKHSFVAAAAGAAEYNARPVMTCCYYSFWRDVPPHLVTIRPRPRRVLVTSPTNDGLTLALVVFPISAFEAVKSDLDRHFMDSMDLAPELAALLREGRRVDRYYGSGDIPNFFRKPYGDGWALAGDAGYHKDPCTAQGISDAFRSAEWLAAAIHAGFSGTRPLQEALADYQQTRDTHCLPIYELTCGLAALEPPPPPIQALHQALRNSQEDINAFFGTLAGTFSIPQFYSPENISRIVTRSAAAGT